MDFRNNLNIKKNERRHNPRYNITFFARNKISLKDNSSELYHGLSKIINISKDGICLELNLSSNLDPDQYLCGKLIELYIDLFFSGNYLNYEGVIAWVNQGKNKTKLGLNLRRFIKNTDIVKIFNEEKKAQERFYLNIIR